MDHSKLIVKSDRVFTSVSEKDRKGEEVRKEERESDKYSKNRKLAGDNMALQACSAFTQLNCHVMTKNSSGFGVVG